MGFLQKTHTTKWLYTKNLWLYDERLFNKENSMKNNDWLENEIFEISREIKIKPKKQHDTMMAIRILLMISAIFFYTHEIDSKPSVDFNMKNAEGGGHLFRCAHCGMNQWKASSQANWAGEFHCSGCKKKL